MGSTLGEEIVSENEETASMEQSAAVEGRVEDEGVDMAGLSDEALPRETVPDEPGTIAPTTDSAEGDLETADSVEESITDLPLAEDESQLPKAETPPAEDETMSIEEETVLEGEKPPPSETDKPHAGDKAPSSDKETLPEEEEPESNEEETSFEEEESPAPSPEEEMLLEEEEALAPEEEGVQNEEGEEEKAPIVEEEFLEVILFATKGEEGIFDQDTQLTLEENPPSINPQDYLGTSHIIWVNLNLSYQPKYEHPFFAVKDNDDSSLVAFCGDNLNAYYGGTWQPNKVTLGTGTAQFPEMLTKLLYYGYGGPGYTGYSGSSNIPEDLSIESDEYMATTLAVHLAMNGTWVHGYGDFIGDADALWGRIATKPFPNWVLRLTPENPSVSVVTVNSQQVQRTALIMLTGGPSNNSIKFTVPSPYTIRKDTIVYTAGMIAEIKIGESFYVEAPLNHIGSFDTGRIWEEIPSKIAVLILSFKGRDMQRIVTRKCYKQYVKMNINFGGAPAVIEGTKAVSDVMAPDTEFFFKIEEVTGLDGNTIKPGGYCGITSLSGAGKFSFTVWKPAAGTYYYKITELESEEFDGWTYDKRSYIVVVIVSGSPLKAQVLYQTGVKVEFLNVFNLNDPKLPETGYWGSGSYTWLGAVLLLLSLFGAGMLYYRRCRYHVEG
ncbi:MAG: hypothetical protein FWG43_00180 [Clostridiales bacterium]|nr:hypothetical protein [Clostridiales bacterium]